MAQYFCPYRVRHKHWTLLWMIKGIMNADGYWDKVLCLSVVPRVRHHNGLMLFGCSNSFLKLKTFLFSSGPPIHQTSPLMSRRSTIINYRWWFGTLSTGDFEHCHCTSLTVAGIPGDIFFLKCLHIIYLMYLHYLDKVQGTVQK